MRQEALMKLKQIIESGNYDVEELLAVVPEELLEEVMHMVQVKTEQESEEIQNNINLRSR